MTTFHDNLHRLLARQALTATALAKRSGIDLRTIKGMLNGSRSRPQARTIHRLAAALEVEVDEFYQNSSTLDHRRFDRQTNPLAAEVVRSRPELFDGWTRGDFDELYSRFGMGGALTTDGTVEVVHLMNRKRETLNKVVVLLESGEADVLRGIVEVLYDKVVLVAKEVDGQHSAAV
ncbi:MAG TPA: helix-turn-helix transcriptional regulator [Pirellulales bacterium]|jgi:transcriptional regulator with XRE-family HTH domain|nr:helix-turn-helix transcriptional regulator [Pirellulales bacterium]